MKERELPEGWEITTFGECCRSIRYGVGMPPQYTEEGIPFVRATNIKKGTITEKNLKFVSLEDSKTIEKCRITEGNLIVVRSGVNTGDSAYVPKKFDGALAGFDLIVEFDKLESAQFFNFLINSQYGKSQINLYKRRAAQEHLNSEQLSSLKVPNPPLPIQRQIVAVLESAEAVMRQRQKADALTGALLQSVFYEMFGDPVTNERGWEEAKLKDITLWHKQGIYTNMSYVENGTKLIRVTDILDDGTLDYPNMPFLNLDSKTIDQFKAEVGDFIFARSGSIGRCAIVKETIPAVFGSFSICFRFNPKKVDNKFFLYFMKIPSVLSRFKKFSHGSANININAENIKDLDIYLPPLALQQQFVRIVQEIERIREQQAKSKREIDVLFGGLMAEAFSGQRA